jgi:hypothetical protein
MDTLVIIATDKVCKEGSKYCTVPKTNGHGTKECEVLLAQVKKMLALYEPTNPFHNYKCQKTDYSKSKSKQMFSFMVNAFKAVNCKEKSNIFNDRKRKANENYAFDDDIFDAINLNDDVCNKNETNADSAEEEISRIILYTESNT